MKYSSSSRVGRPILASSDPSDQLVPVFVYILLKAFKRTENIKYLNELIHNSINTWRIGNQIYSTAAWFGIFEI